jgi:hypothetical protein
VRLVLAPWEWTDDGWRKPGGDYTGGCIDLRTLAQAGTPGPAASGLGLFAYEDLPPGIQVAADLGDDPLARMTVRRRNELADALGIARASLSDASLATILAEQVLGSLADPAGIARTKPLRMNHRGAVVHLKGFGRIWRTPFDSAHPIFLQTLGVRRVDYARVRAMRLERAEQEIARGRDREAAETAALNALRRWNDYDAVSLGVDVDQIVPTRFVSDGRIPHATTYTETWPTDSSTISSGQDRAWNEDSGDVRTTSDSYLTTLETDPPAFGRCTDDLSSDDHYHEALGTFAASEELHEIGVGVRKIDSTTKTFYEVRGRRSVFAASSNFTIRKYVAGTGTALDTDSVEPAASVYYLYCQANGSSIEAVYFVTTLGPVTDTDITGNLLVAYELRSPLDFDGLFSLDTQEFGDLSPTGTVYELSPTVSAAATTAVSVGVKRGVSATADGTSTATATAYSVFQLHAGSEITGAATVSAGMQVVRPIMAQADGAASATATPYSIRSLVADRNLLSNPGFDNPSDDWVLGANWQIANGVASQTAPVFSAIRQNVAATAGATYRVRFTVSGNTTGSLQATIGNEVGSLHSGNGTFEDTIVATTTGQFLLTTADLWDGSVDDVSLEELSTAAVSMGVVRSLAASVSGVGATSLAIGTGARVYELDAHVDGAAAASAADNVHAVRSATVSAVAITQASINVVYTLSAEATGVATPSVAVRVSTSYTLSAEAASTVAVTASMELADEEEVAEGKYAAEHALAYQIVQQAEEQGYDLVHARAFLDISRAGV